MSIGLAILTSIITGGFVLVFVEIGNRKNRENDCHDGILTPFMHKLSSFFRFVNWCKSQVIYPNDINGNEEEFRSLVNMMAKYGVNLIIRGGYYTLDSFTARELNDIALQINNIWYYHNKMHPCRLEWEGRVPYDGTDYIAKELKEINPVYLTEKQGISLLAKVSEDFYVDVYQPVEYESFKYEAYLKHYNSLTVWVAVFFSFVLLMLCLMLFIKLPVLFLQIASAFIVLSLVISLIALAIDVKFWVRWKGEIMQRKHHRIEARERRRLNRKCNNRVR